MKPTRVVVLEPAFSEYRRAAERHGRQVVYMSLLGPWNSSAPWFPLPTKLPAGCPTVALVTLHMGQVNLFLLQFHRPEIGHLVEQLSEFRVIRTKRVVMLAHF
ncbi:hypothetical protein JZ785_03280 [Alicyclobacillus curvatus]|nr:hypothetical protein JZ785_03280 [Alicyclobacillus curvatus]